jgi:hypothetical protein
MNEPEAAHRWFTLLFPSTKLRTLRHAGRTTFRSGRVSIVGLRVATGPSCESTCDVCDRLLEAVPAAVAADGLPDVSLEAICRFAGIDARVARKHLRDRTRPLVVAGFEHAHESLLADYQAGFTRAETWHAGIEAALTGVLTRLAAQPALAHLCFVAVLHDRQLLQVRECRRERFVLFLARQHDRRAAAGEMLPPLQFELLAGGIFRAVAAFVQEGRLGEPTGRLVDEVLQAVHVFDVAAA